MDRTFVSIIVINVVFYHTILGASYLDTIKAISKLNVFEQVDFISVPFNVNCILYCSLVANHNCIFVHFDNEDFRMDGGADPDDMGTIAFDFSIHPNTSNPFGASNCSYNDTKNIWCNHLYSDGSMADSMVLSKNLNQVKKIKKRIHEEKLT